MDSPFLFYSQGTNDCELLNLTSTFSPFLKVSNGLFGTLVSDETVDFVGAVGVILFDVAEMVGYVRWYALLLGVVFGGEGTKGCAVGEVGCTSTWFDKGSI